MAGMTAAERRDHIMAKLRSERQTTVTGLMKELGCSARTVRYDIEALTVSGFPLETVRGRYGGGVKLPDWYHPHSLTLSPQQMALLKRVAPSLSLEDQRIMSSILDQFGPRR